MNKKLVFGGIATGLASLWIPILIAARRDLWCWNWLWPIHHQWHWHCWWRYPGCRGSA